jgi:metal-responsive CopG/Arc/MetJ family transcriptional regulator
MLWCMRTTIRLDDHLLQEVKQLAAQRGSTMTAIIEEALRQMLAHRRAQSADAPPIELITVAGNGLQPGVDLDDSAALLDLMAGHNVAG